jgi:uncharacterized protein (DUF433 family)
MGFFSLEWSKRLSTISIMEASFWKDCPLIEVDPEVKHGRAVFKGTRFVVEEAIEDVQANQELGGLSEEEAIQETLKSHPTIPGADALRAVIAYEAAHEHLLAP